MQFVNDAEFRAGDADRDATISELREAYAEGRLLPEEFNDRLDRAQEAKTFADLRAVTADLPRETAIAAQEPSESAMERRKLRSDWLRGWVLVSSSTSFGSPLGWAVARPRTTGPSGWSVRGAGVW